MKSSKFSEEQVVGILRAAQGGMGVSDVRQMRVMSEEIARLMRIFAGLIVQNDILKVVNAKKW